MNKIITKLNRIVLMFTAICATLAVMSVVEPVFANGSNFSVKADTIEYDMRSGDGTAKGNVVLRQDGGTATAASAEFNSKNKSGRLMGGVVANRDDARVICDTFVMHNEDYSSAIGGASLTKGDKTLTSNQVDYYQAREYAETIGSWAKLSMTDGSILDASKIIYDGKNGIANANGGVSISSPPRNLTASGDSAVYETNNSGYIELVGNAKATQDGNTVEGNRLKLNNTTSTAEAHGSVKIVYIPKPEDKINSDVADKNLSKSAPAQLMEVA